MTTTSPSAIDQTMTIPTDQDMIAAYLEHLRRAGCSADTLKLRRKLLTHLNRDLARGVGETDPQELATWLHREEWVRGTRATYYAGLRSFYGWACARDPWLSFNPMIDVERISALKGVARPVTDEQLSRILTAAEEPYRTWAVIASYQGLRCCEISGLHREHVTQQRLYVVRGKGGKPRVHDTDPYVWAAVCDLPPGPVARLKRSGNRASADYISGTTAAHFRSLGVDATLHQCRHWLGVTTQRVYRDIRVTQAVLGHESLSATQIYTMASMEQQREARASLPRLAG
jgi:integrase